MNKILFISCCVPDELETEITQYCKSSINIHDAANTFQKSLIHGFIENNANLEVLSAPSLPAFPLGYKRIYIPKMQTRIEGKVLCDILPYFSFMIGKYASIERRIVKYVKEWINLYSNDELTIIGYNINAAFMEAMKTIKSNFPKVQTALIVTDMIEDAFNFKSNTTFLKRIQVSLHTKKIYSSYQAIDKYILLSEQMRNRIPNCKDNYIVVEGIYTHCGDIPNIDRQQIIFYSGALDTYVNVVEMIEAFKKIIYCEKERVRILREDLKIEEKDCYAIMYKLDNVDVEQLTVANRDFLMQDDQTVDKKLQQAMSMGLYDPNRNLSYLSKMHLVDALQCNYLMDTLDPNEKAQHDLIESEHYDMSDRQIQPQAEYFHLHSQHIVEHNIYRVSPEVRMLKEKEPEQYKALMQMLENHIKQHEDFEKQSKQPDVVSGAKAIFGGTANK